MPSTVKVRVIEARDLPVMERNMQGDLYTDAYVDIRFANQEVRTQVQRKTLNPFWDEDFRFEVADDSVLQSEPIEFRVMDHDVYTRWGSPQLPPPSATIACETCPSTIRTRHLSASF